MTRRPCALLAVLAAFATPVAASAAPMAFTAFLTIQTTVTLNAFQTTASGVGDSSGQGFAAALPANAFPISGRIDATYDQVTAFEFGAPGPFGASSPIAPGGHGAFTWAGTVGFMPILASIHQFRLGQGNAFGRIGLDRLGVGGTATNYTLYNAFVLGIAQGQGYRLGMGTAVGQFGALPAVGLVGTGFDQRTEFGIGTLQVVSPMTIDLGGLGSMGVLATLGITFTPIPEPGTVALVGLGLVALAAGARRRAA